MFKERLLVVLIIGMSVYAHEDILTVRDCAAATMTFDAESNLSVKLPVVSLDGASAMLAVGPISVGEDASWNFFVPAEGDYRIYLRQSSWPYDGTAGANNESVNNVYVDSTKHVLRYSRTGEIELAGWKWIELTGEISKIGPIHLKQGNHKLQIIKQSTDFSYYDLFRLETSSAETSSTTSTTKILEEDITVELKKDYARKGLSGQGMYLPGETVNCLINIKSQGTGENRLTFSYRIIDFWDNVLKEAKEVIKISSGLESVTEINYHPLKNGTYTFSYALIDTDKTVKVGNVFFCVVPKEEKSVLPANDSPFGVVHGIICGVGDMFSVSGVRWDRNSTYWHLIEPVKGTRDWTSVDSIVNQAEKYNAELLIICSSSTPWATSAKDKNDPMAIFRAPDISEWKTYITAISNKYKGKIKYWDLWGEPEWTFEGNTRAEKAEKYVQMLKVSWEAIKSADPESKIIAVGTSPSSFDLAESIFKAGGLKYMDIYSLHPYRPGGGSPEATNAVGEITRMRELMIKYGGADKRIWMTEFGWTGDDFDPLASEYQKKRLVLTEKQQASYLVRMYTLCMGLGYVDKFFWFVLSHPARGLAESADAGEGMIDYNKRVKPVLIAHRTLCDELEGARFIEKKVIGDSLYFYTFTKGDNKVTVAWSSKGNELLLLDGGGENISIMDIMHNRIEMAGTEGQFLFTADSVPVFIESNKFKIVGRVVEPVIGEDMIQVNPMMKTTPFRIVVPIHNITSGRFKGEIMVDKALSNMMSETVLFDLEPGQSRDCELWVNIPSDAIGPQEISLYMNYTGLVKGRLVLEKEFTVLGQQLAVIEDFEKDISGWVTNSNEKHVEYNTIEKSDKYVQSGTYSLHWKCKSNMWNTISRDVSDIDFKNARQLILWVYIPELPDGNSTLSVELYRKSGMKYGFYGKMPLSRTGEWIKYAINIDDFQSTETRVDPEGKLTSGVIGTLLINYTGGTLECYIDNISITK